MAEVDNLIDTLHPLEIKTLGVLAGAASGKASSEEDIAKASGLEPSQLNMAIEWLLAKSLVRVESERVVSQVSLTTTGEQFFEKYAPIERILSSLREAAERDARLTIQDIQVREQLEPSEISGAIGCLKKEGAIQIVAGGVIQSTDRPSPTAEALRTLLQQLRGTRRTLDAFPEAMQRVIRQYAVKRGNTREPFRIDDQVFRTYCLTPEGREAVGMIRAHGGTDEVSQLTPELLKDGSWRNKRFRKYTISLRAPRIGAGKRHPYREFLDTVKAKFVGMGFREMRGPLVETEFWNMDALYMPQFHPARDIHDVYFVKEPKAAEEIPEPFLSNVAAAHHDGGETASTGWGYQFDLERSRRMILRSQGTAVSARTLASGPEVPGKYFSIARCFRYDQVDATHAPDFYQIEGIVLGAEITFRTLLGLLGLFAREIAQAKESKFMPAYFPFTEPSVELHVRHPRLGWMELGGAGLLRPEVTLPLGVRVPVIAWGLGLDRMAMVALGIHDIRDLFTTNLELIRTTRARL